MLTHMHKVKHLVVSTFDQGWRSWIRVGVVLHRPNAGHEVTGLGGGASGQWHRGAWLGLHDQTLHSDCD